MKNRVWPGLLASALLMLFLGVSAFANPPQAHASALHPTIPHCSLIIQNAGVTSTGPEYYVRAYNGTQRDATLHLGASNSVSNSLTGTIGFTVGFISGQVGFDVTHNTTVTYDWTVTIPPNMTGRIDVYEDFDTYLLTNSCTHAQAVASRYNGALYYNAYTY